MTIDIMHFTPQRTAAIYLGEPLTDEERAYLLDDTPTFEECSHSKEELAAMNDADLMQRDWACDECGAVHDRDVNAARNILRVGQHTLLEGARP